MKRKPQIEDMPWPKGIDPPTDETDVDSFIDPDTAAEDDTIDTDEHDG
jgi:hypothetical protein